MFLFNAAVMGFGNSMWMHLVLEQRGPPARSKLSRHSKNRSGREEGRKGACLCRGWDCQAEVLFGTEALPCADAQVDALLL